MGDVGAEIVHLTVQTPCRGAETWHSESRKLTTRDHPLFDMQHAVLPTTLELPTFYEELVKTQAVLARKHLGVAALAETTRILARHLAHGQTNFLKTIWDFCRVYNPRPSVHRSRPRGGLRAARTSALLHEGTRPRVDLRAHPGPPQAGAARGAVDGMAGHPGAAR